MHTTVAITYNDRLGSLQHHRRRPERHQAVLTAGDERPVGREVDDAQHRFAMRHRLAVGRQLKPDLPGPSIRVLDLGILELHVRAELVPRDGALRRAVDLPEERVDLRLLLMRTRRRQTMRHCCLLVCSRRTLAQVRKNDRQIEWISRFATRQQHDQAKTIRRKPGVKATDAFIDKLSMVREHVRTVDDLLVTFEEGTLSSALRTALNSSKSSFPLPPLSANSNA
jgi:hypothetical protein